MYSRMTTDRNDPGLRELDSDGMQKKYLILSEQERAKGFVRPVRYSYTHIKCDYSTVMGQSLSETYARNPKFYSGTYCSLCKKHFNLIDEQGEYAFLWVEDGTPVGE